MDAILKQQQSFYDQQQASQRADAEGMQKARQEEVIREKHMQIRSVHLWKSLRVQVILGGFILLFVHNMFFAENNQLFWGLCAALNAIVLYQFANIVKKDGALALGWL